MMYLKQDVTHLVNLNVYRICELKAPLRIRWTTGARLMKRHLVIRNVHQVDQAGTITHIQTKPLSAKIQNSLPERCEHIEQLAEEVSTLSNDAQRN